MNNTYVREYRVNVNEMETSFQFLFRASEDQFCDYLFFFFHFIRKLNERIEILILRKYYIRSV